MANKTTLGVLVGNRGFFPNHLCEVGREAILKTLAEEKIESVILPGDATKFGAVETLEDARKCAALFKERRDDIDGVLVTLPNFGDERAVANTINSLRQPFLEPSISIRARRTSSGQRASCRPRGTG